MTVGFFNITELGLVVYTICIISTIWIVAKKKYKIAGIIFPIFTLTEGLFIDWRWGKIDQFSAQAKFLLGVIPSFLIAIGFPFMVFYLHYLLPKSFRSYLGEAKLFPFTSSAEIEHSRFNNYYKVGLGYSCATLLLHELSQVFNLSSRNTFDVFDLVAIIAGSLVSLTIFLLLQRRN